MSTTSQPAYDVAVRLIDEARADGKKLPSEYGWWEIGELAEMANVDAYRMSQAMAWFRYELRHAYKRVWWPTHVGRGARWALLSPRAWRRVMQRALVENIRRIIREYDTRLATMAALNPNTAAQVAIARAHLRGLIAFASQEMPDIVFPNLNGVPLGEDDE